MHRSLKGLLSNPCEEDVEKNDQFFIFPTNGTLME
jgi:hypothetical protein